MELQMKIESEEMSGRGNGSGGDQLVIVDRTMGGIVDGKGMGKEGEKVEAGGSVKTKPRRTKVKTGCFTCRVRRVKCDEAKPYCARCLKFGVDCDGYPSSSTTSTTTHPIAPRYRRFIPQIFTSSPSSILPRPPGLRIESETEARCIKIYCEEMAQEIRGPFQTQLWERLIPQISEAEPFIRHAIIAIGAISKFKRKDGIEGEGGDMSDMKRDEDGRGIRESYTYALRQYEKALRGMREAIKKRKHDMRKALIACVLVFCFETLLGNSGTASKNAESGLMLFYMHTKTDPKFMKTIALGGYCGGEFVEEGITAAFAGLDLHVLFFLDNRPIEVHEMTIAKADPVIVDMPDVFGTLDEARVYWSLVMRRNYHFIKAVLIEGKAEELCGPWPYSEEGNAPWENASDVFPGGNMFSTPKEPPLRRLPAGFLYKEQTRGYLKRCEGLFERIWRDGKENERLVVALIRIHGLMSDIMLSGCFFTTEVAFDQYIPEFGQMMELVEFVYPFLTSSQTSMSAGYKFDLGITIANFLVGFKCRDKAIRKRAVDFLMAKHYREGVWDSRAAGIMLRWVEKMEDAARGEDGFVKEEDRCFFTGAFMDIPGKRGILGASRRGKDGLVFLEHRFTWP